MKWFNDLKQLFKGKKLTTEGYAHNERRIEYKNRGTVPWDEPYERRNKPHTY